MSYADIPADTEAQQILAALDDLSQRTTKLTEALNSLGANVQWLVDNCQGIFQMFNSPMFGAMLSGAMSGEGMIPGMAELMGTGEPDNG